MAGNLEFAPVLAAYPDDCQPSRVEPLGSAGGFSGACFWRLTTPRGLLCLRRWPPGYPEVEHLQFIQAVLWHVVHEGFTQVPLPLETRLHAGYVPHDGYFWELAPWLSGTADFGVSPSDAKLTAALRTLADFHQAAEGFPLADIGPSPAPGSIRRRDRFNALRSGGIRTLADAIRPSDWPQLADRARQLVRLFAAAADQNAARIERATRLRVALQPCIRDVWRDHVLFVGDRVSGMIDFGGLRPDNVATDVARLLGNLAEDDRTAWDLGLAAYESVRPLSDDERALVGAFDKTAVLMSGLQWVEWIYIERRVFADRITIEARLDTAIGRLERLIGERHKTEREQ